MYFTRRVSNNEFIMTQALDKQKITFNVVVLMSTLIFMNYVIKDKEIGVS